MSVSNSPPAGHRPHRRAPEQTRSQPDPPRRGPGVRYLGMLLTAALAVTAALANQPSSAADERAAPPPATAAVSDTLRVQGNRLLDTCGQPFVVRGAETFLGLGIDIGGSRTRVVEELVSTGVNAVRLIPNVGQLSVTEIDRFLTIAAAARVVVFLTPNGGNSWFRRSDVKSMLARHQKWLIIDAYGEAPFDDRDRWQDTVESAIRDLRAQGYTVPLTVLANLYGRDLPSLFERGAEIVAADPLRNTVLGWQAYWGQSGWYQRRYGMSLTEGIRRAAAQPFPIQIGIDHFADPNEPMDYPAAMTAAEQHDVGWLWWDWYNPFGRRDNLTADGTAERLTDVGEEVINDHPAGIRATAAKACGQ